MHLPMAIVVTTTLMAAQGGDPGALACAGRGFVHQSPHTHALQAATRYTAPTSEPRNGATEGDGRSVYLREIVR